MPAARQWEFAGTHGAVTAHIWPHDTPRYAAVLVHGYGEHLGRYDHVAAALHEHGAVVCGPDHAGHGLSAGDRVLVRDVDDLVADLHTVVESAREDLPGVPVVMIGHSLGGLIATRYAQLHGDRLTALVLSGPVLGRWDSLAALRDLDEIPDVPIDVSTLSRDPGVGRAYAADPLVWHGPFKPATVRGLLASIETVNAHGTLGDLPVLWLHGEDDPLVPVSGTRVGIDAVRGADLTSRLYPGARHEIFNETNRDEVLADVTTAIDAWLAPPPPR
ncbi:alpha/beta hydrolase [Actinomadura oligospora]|uniref:alpha/beta hydrolase n=1 Tax=Actinomadura oligospora TaxID=111804 RepID=UPI00047DCDD6|nr:alpha/beta hydrolase [Actinomadura oligospora]